MQGRSYRCSSSLPFTASAEEEYNVGRVVFFFFLSSVISLVHIISFWDRPGRRARRACNVPPAVRKKKKEKRSVQPDQAPPSATPQGGRIRHRSPAIQIHVVPPTATCYQKHCNYEKAKKAKNGLSGYRGWSREQRKQKCGYFLIVRLASLVIFPPGWWLAGEAEWSLSTAPTIHRSHAPHIRPGAHASAGLVNIGGRTPSPPPSFVHS